MLYQKQLQLSVGEITEIENLLFSPFEEDALIHSGSRKLPRRQNGDSRA